MSFYYRRKLRKIGKALLESSEKVELYRGDVLTKEALNEQLELADKVRAASKNRTIELTQVEVLINQLHEVLVRNGGKIYPLTTGCDYTEMVVMAAIVAGSIRSFFLQPFKIPTNSMWPTYNGMTAEVRSIKDGEPTFPFAGYNSRLAPQFFPGGDVRHLVRAEVDGEVFVPLKSFNQGGYGESLDNGIWGTRLFKSTAQEGRVFVRDREGKVHVHTFTVPLEFDLTDVWQKTYFPESSRILKPEHYYAKREYERILRKAQLEDRIQEVAGERCVIPETITRVKQGELLLNFDVLTGDMLFVDRMSYNFVDPARGDTFVFRTNNIPGLNSRSDGQPSQNYYVKRLAGVPGQKLRVGAQGELFVDGKVVTSPEPMVLNSQRAMNNGYYGYLQEASGYYARYQISLQREYTVSAEHFFALGDNSANSMDSRGWGEVPGQDVVGKPLFILHPFTSHWGPAK